MAQFKHFIQNSEGKIDGPARDSVLGKLLFTRECGDGDDVIINCNSARNSLFNKIHGYIKIFINYLNDYYYENYFTDKILFDQYPEREKIRQHIIDKIYKIDNKNVPSRQWLRISLIKKYHLFEKKLMELLNNEAQIKEFIKEEIDKLNNAKKLYRTLYDK